MRKQFILSTIICLLAACVCFAAYPMKARDARGKEVTLQSRPVRIVSLTPNNTEILYALGLGSRIVGVNKYSDYPPEAKKKPAVGDMNINTEAVVGLKPDLVVAHAFINGTAIGRLERLRLSVFAIDPKTISQVIRDIRTLGNITARPRTAEGVAKKMEAAIADVKKSRAGKTPRKVLVVIQSNPLWAAGPKTFVDEMIHLANASNVAADSRPGFVTFSKELAVTRNPDVIIVGMKADADYFMKNSAWRNAAAVKNKRVYVVNNDLLVRPGPRLAAGLRELAKRVDF